MNPKILLGFSLRVTKLTKFQFILLEVAAIGIRLSHASTGSQDTGKLLSNTSIICPWVPDNLGKLRLTRDREILLECVFPQKQCPRMSWRRISLLVG